MSESLHEEVIGLTRDLIRLDTTNSLDLGLGHETLAAEHLCDYLTRNGVECELVAREPKRANVVARIPGVSTGSNPDSDSTADSATDSTTGGRAPSLAFVGHTDVVPVDPRDWTHPPFEAVLDDDGWLWGRGAIDMKNEVAARAVAMAELARTGFRPQGDLWFVAVADEEDGVADVGMRWLLEERTDLRPTYSVNEGGGELVRLSDGRSVVNLSAGEKGTLPVTITAVGEAGHASVPTLGENAVPLLARLLPRLGDGMPPPAMTPVVRAMAAALLGRDEPDPQRVLAEVATLSPGLGAFVHALMGSTLAPTKLSASPKRNVMPARASAEVDCRILPDTTAADVEARVRALLGDDLAYELSWPEPMVAGSSSPVTGVIPDAVAAFVAAEYADDPAQVLPVLCAGFTDSNYLRARGTAAYGFSPFRATSSEVLDAGYHNADERIHVDDLLLSVRFHLDLARRVLG